MSAITYLARPQHVRSPSSLQLAHLQACAVYHFARTWCESWQDPRQVGYGGLDITKTIPQLALERSTFLPETELYFELSSLPRNCRRWHHHVTFSTSARWTMRWSTVIY